MQTADRTLGNLVRQFTEHHMESLFYFCLKKTGNQTEAEDLTHDIACHILTALQRGTIPTHFSAWVWQIARNRYAAWAEKKHVHLHRISGCDIDDFEIEGEDPNPLDGIIDAEQTALLRRELAFIRSDYRNLIVAYYIENRSVHDIAASLSLSHSAVQQRLHRARIILKEGMDMARTFGKRSYNPDDITFAASGNQPSGLPWTAVGRSIPKNILLQASNNPSTAEELSMELGIALPYMEEEIALLVNATLLEKQGDRYLTNFFIMDKDCKTDIYHAIRRESKERSRLIRELLEAQEAEIASLGIHGAHMDVKEMRWYLIPDLIDRLIVTFVDDDIYQPPVRANGETWGFVGYEEMVLPESIVMGHNGSGSGGNMFWTYKYSLDAMWDQCGEPEYEEVLLLCDCLRNQRTVDSLTESELYLWKRIDGRYAHAEENGTIVADILVFRGDTLKKLRDLYNQHPAYETLVQNMKDTRHAVEDILRRCSHKVLHSHLGYYTRMELYAARMMAIHDLLECGYLTLPADAGKSNVGMHLILS